MSANLCNSVRRVSKYESLEGTIATPILDLQSITPILYFVGLLKKLSIFVNFPIFHFIHLQGLIHMLSENIQLNYKRKVRYLQFSACDSLDQPGRAHWFVRRHYLIVFVRFLLLFFIVGFSGFLGF